MKHTVFLTGATGFLGTQIARRLLLNPEIEIFALLRSQDAKAAEARLRREWWDWPELRDAVGMRVHALPGDVTLPCLGLDPVTYARLAGQVTHIIHSAADIRLFAPLDQLRRTNTAGTAHALELARAVHAAHGLSRFAHVSTAYVAGARGARSGVVREEDLSDSAGFSSPYEQSKYEAEQLVRKAGADLPASIFRPGMIVGDSRDGAVRTFNTLYYPLRMYLTGQLRIAPAKRSLRVNLVPVDYVAQAVARLTFDPAAAGLTFHLTPPQADMPTLGEITEFARTWAKAEMGLNLPRVWFLSLPGLEKAAGFLSRFLSRDMASLARLLPYFGEQPEFSRVNTDALCGAYPHRWRDLLPPLLAYAVHYSFWHRTSRTVYEQILFRLQSKHKPVTYHDLAGGKEILRPAAEMHEEILAAASALQALGVTPGDRVAITGLNSSRYFAALIANGLVGAVSTPLYATCPPEEIQTLLEDCQPRLFLVGAREVLKRLDEIHYAGPVVSLCGGRVALPEGVMRWQDFLALGRGRPFDLNELPPAALDAPVALYYTSGTTGRPKGVVFCHEQLRWLGETLASMYPWHERTRAGAYLSYLPMNHVVEGFLAMYSPYYAPAALDIYFLEEFDGLQEALKIARPTIFFSVPRFFEKVRATVLENRLAQIHQRLGRGVLRRLTGGLLRRGMLRKTGLDACRQIIVGSAQSAPELLEFFTDLGIEVHDAYGLTEAPLITLNRLGHNRPGSVGSALPDTEIRLAEDGEVIVRGPQVAAGYYNQGGMILPFAGGNELVTGDLGCLSADGYLTLIGRKKDILITSYAKNIFPLPVEAKLRALPGVAEALLVGEGRPHCAALLWIEENSWSPAAAQLIDTGIAQVNAHLSHPEQIKRWAVLPGGLTIENGCMTGSMKIKREVVTARLSGLVEALYRGETLPGVLYSSASTR